ncbi:MAG: LCP family protein [Anaerolineae bacterium]|nr:LCP family protein [Anaerolineae bacterium]
MRLPGWLFLLIVGLMVAATAICSFGAFNFAYRFNVDLADSGVQIAGGSFDLFLTAQPTATLPPSPVPPTHTPEPGTTLVPIATEIVPTIAAGPTATLDPLAAYHWDDPSRLNVLVLGIDQRGDEQGPFRTDTMMVVSIDPIRKTVGMLSIPRDLWVPIPGFQPNRINTANALGDSNGYPGGGAALAAAAVEQNFGIGIDRYIRVNFDVFDAVVNLIAPNGVEVCPSEVIDDPDYPDAGYGYIAIHFDPGCQRLDAVHLLQYARTRATQGGDFDRAARQQEVLKALFSEVVSAGGVANIITQAPALWTELSDAISTNFTLEELFGLANLGLQIPRENIQSGTVNNLYVNLATTSQGDQVLTPRWDAIRFLMDDVFNPRAELSLAELRDRALAENAEIVVYNNTDVVGLAGQVRDWLQAQGVTVANVGNMPQITNVNTYIQDYSGKLHTAHFLTALLGLPDESIRTATDGLTSADLMLVIGPDIQEIIAGR